MTTQEDHKYMELALQLARRGLGKTRPNPAVGAVIVKRGRIIGTGWHRRYGGPHAEVFALRQAGRAAQGATLYVTLEPCSHFGKTPPCAPAVAQAGICRVVAAMRDPNPKVAGQGFSLLRKAGVRVEVGLCADEAKRLNAVFCKNILTGLPYVICKAALSLDGKIACHTGASRWISGPAARRFAHELRAVSEAVVVGGGTVLADDPELTVRLGKASATKGPLKVILEGKRRIPFTAKLFKNAECQGVILATTDSKRRVPVALAGVEVWHLPGRQGRVDAEALLRRLAERGVCQVLVEGGADTHAVFLGTNGTEKRILADRIHFILAPVLIGGRQAPGPIGGKGAKTMDQAVHLRDMEWKPLGQDILVTATPT